MKRFNAALVFKRAVGRGSTITSIEGLDRILAEHGEHIPVVDLVPWGRAARTGPRSSRETDGWWRGTWISRNAGARRPPRLRREAGERR